MGAVTAIIYTAQILDSPFSSFNKLINEIGEKQYNIPKFILNQLLDLLKNQIIEDTKGLDLFKLDVTKDIQKIKCPCLFIYSEKDDLINHSHSLDLMNIFSGSCNQLIINENHNDLRDQNCYKNIIEFINKVQIIKGNNEILSIRKSKIHEISQISRSSNNFDNLGFTPNKGNKHKQKSINQYNKVYQNNQNIFSKSKCLTEKQANIQYTSSQYFNNEIGKDKFKKLEQLEALKQRKNIKRSQNSQQNSVHTAVSTKPHFNYFIQSQNQQPKIERQSINVNAFLATNSKQQSNFKYIDDDQQFVSKAMENNFNYSNRNPFNFRKSNITSQPNLTEKSQVQWNKHSQKLVKILQGKQQLNQKNWSIIDFNNYQVQTLGPEKLSSHKTSNNNSQITPNTTIEQKTNNTIPYSKSAKIN